MCLCHLFGVKVRPPRAFALLIRVRIHAADVPLPVFQGQRRICQNRPFFHARYDWTTGVPDNGNVWGKCRVVPRAYPSHPPICAYFHKVGNKERFRLPGAGGGALPLYSGPFVRS